MQLYSLNQLELLILLLLILVPVCDMKMNLVFMNLYFKQRTHACNNILKFNTQEWVIFIQERQSNFYTEDNKY